MAISPGVIDIGRDRHTPTNEANPETNNIKIFFLFHPQHGANEITYLLIK